MRKRRPEEMVEPECFDAIYKDIYKELRVMERYEGKGFELSAVTWGDSVRPACRIILHVLSRWRYGCSFPIGRGRRLSHERASYDCSEQKGRE